jgi:hypothetical protein
MLSLSLGDVLGIEIADGLCGNDRGAEHDRGN